jgi:hypothetical protein
MSHPARVILSRADRVSRALSQVGVRMQYHLGHGGRDPLAADPFDREDPHFGYVDPATHRNLELPTCDCSGFTAWASGVDRFQPGHLEGLDYDGDSGGTWFNCAAIVQDAQHGGPHHLWRALAPDEQVLPGDLAVMGPRPGHPWGHATMFVELLPGFQAAREWSHLNATAVPTWGPECQLVHCAPFSGDKDVHRTNGDVMALSRRAYLVRLQLNGADQL